MVGRSRVRGGGLVRRCVIRGVGEEHELFVSDDVCGDVDIDVRVSVCVKEKVRE